MRITNHSFAALAVAVLAVVMACGRGENGDEAAAAPPLQQWSLSEPVLVLGGNSEASGHQFGGVRGALFLNNGNLVVADGLTREIRLFDGRGELQATLGRSGGGPGEFRVISGISHGPEDGICAWDGQLARIICFSQAGELRSTTDIDLSEAEQPRPCFVGMLWDGSVIFADKPYLRNMREDPVGERRDSVTLLQYGPDGIYQGVLAEVGGTETILMRHERGVSTNMEILFGKSSIVELHADRVAVGMNDSLHVDVLDADGEGLWSLRRSRQLVPVRTAWVAARKEQMLRELEQEEASRIFQMDAASTARLASANRLQIRDLPHRDHLPEFLRMALSDDGSVWIDALSSEGESSGSWRVISPEGELVARISLPAGSQILDIHGRKMLLLTRDSLDVETVTLHSIVTGE